MPIFSTSKVDREQVKITRCEFEPDFKSVPIPTQKTTIPPIVSLFDHHHTDAAQFSQNTSRKTHS